MWLIESEIAVVVVDAFAELGSIFLGCGKGVVFVQSVDHFEFGTVQEDSGQGLSNFRDATSRDNKRRVGQ